MNITIRQTISDAFNILGVESQSLPAEDGAYERALNFLKSYLSTLTQQNLEIFLRSPYNTLDDILPVKITAYMFVVSSFAVYVAPIFNISPADEAYQSALKTAKDAENDMRALFGPEIKSVFPANLPVGAGNTYEQNNWGWDFYPDLDPEIYKEDCECSSSIFSNKGNCK